MKALTTVKTLKIDSECSIDSECTSDDGFDDEYKVTNLLSKIPVSFHRSADGLGRSRVDYQVRFLQGAGSAHTPSGLTARGLPSLLACDDGSIRPGSCRTHA
jgi:hypothetical protein